jgi:hypothetical protein
MLAACEKNRIEFRYVLNNVWYASAENMSYVKEELKKEFVMPVKANRKMALALEDKKRGSYEQVGSLEPEPNAVGRVYVEEVEFPLLLTKQVFKNEDGSEGVLYLLSSGVMLDYLKLIMIYQRRRKVEEYHKSLKSNSSLEKSPTKTVRTQGNHCFDSIYSFVKLERLKIATKRTTWLCVLAFTSKQSRQLTGSYKGCACPMLSSQRCTLY